MSSETKPRLWKVSFYSDVKCMIPVDVIDLGELWDGESVERVVYMRNDEPHYAQDITFNVAVPEVSVEGPDTLLSGAVAALKLRWTAKPGEELSLRSAFEACAVLLLRAP